MGTAKKTGIVDKVKNAIAVLFSADESKPAKRATPAPKASAKPKSAKKVFLGSKKATSKAAKKAAVAEKGPAKKALSKPPSTSMDRKLIALSEPYEVRDWCESLKCTEPQLRAAVAAVGPSAEKVRAHLTAKTGRSMDRKLIALSQPHEMRDWCESLGCDEATLRAAVAAVGSSAAKVRAHLGK